MILHDPLRNGLADRKSPVNLARRWKKEGKKHKRKEEGKEATRVEGSVD